MKPSVGRIVHYVSYGTPGGEYGSECRAAVITGQGKGDRITVRNGAGEVVVDEYDGDLMSVSLCVLNPEGMFFKGDIPFSDQHQGGTWHWPEMVKE